MTYPNYIVFWIIIIFCIILPARRRRTAAYHHSLKKMKGRAISSEELKRLMGKKVIINTVNSSHSGILGTITEIGSRWMIVTDNENKEQMVNLACITKVSEYPAK